jgi:hypothetical protein
MSPGQNQSGATGNKRSAGARGSVRRRRLHGRDRRLGLAGGGGLSVGSGGGGGGGDRRVWRRPSFAAEEGDVVAARL